MSQELILIGRAFVNGNLKETEIGISEGKITYVGPSAGRGDRRIDLGSNRIILPGGVDPHVHFRDPGMTHKEDFGTGSASAISGGITCVLDMPNTIPPAVDRETVVEKKARLRKRSYCDYGLFAAITANSRPSKVADLVAGYKLFMGSTTGKILTNDDNVIADMVGEVMNLGKVLSVHAEDDSMILKGTERNCTDHLRNRPAAAEANAIRRLSKFKGGKINICHLTTVEGLNLAKSYGFTTEVTLHHIMFSSDRGSDAKYKVNPPLRESAAREALFKAFEQGEITMFGSDHAPHALSEKENEFDLAPSGMPGVETTLPILMNMVRKGTLPLSRVVEMCSTAPARVFGMNKGSVEVGKDADFSVFNLQNRKEIKGDCLHSKAGYTPYEGREAVFPDMVLLRGEMQLKDGEFCGETMGADIIG